MLVQAMILHNNRKMLQVHLSVLDLHEHPYIFYNILLLLLAALITLKYLYYFKKNSRESRTHCSTLPPPGTLGLPLIGETLQFMAAIKSARGFYEFVRIRRRRYGKCFKTNIFGETHVFVSSTDSVKMILNNEQDKFTKRYLKSISELVGHRSLLCASHHHHKLIRSRLAGLFSAKSLLQFVKHFDQLVVNSLTTWEEKATVVVHQEALKITFKAMCKLLMSLESDDELQILLKDVTLVCEAMLAFPLKLPGTRFYKGLQARKRIMGTVEREICERRKQRKVKADPEEDFLDHLVQMNQSDQQLSDAEIKDNILTMIIAGEDTTASAITWMVKYLDENPATLDALRAQHLPIARKLSNQSCLTLEDLNEMPYASKVVRESLRMASIVPWFPRVALRDCEIEGFEVKKGWNVNIDTRSIHLDPTVYNDPNSFNPSRFDDDSKVPYSFLAFGIGGRTCLGLNMAKSMMLIFLHRLITTYKWKVVDQDSSVEKLAVFSRLKSGCPIQVTSIKDDLITST